ncbi:glycosyltransferase family 4 protein [Candidatus Microthrix parvicella]|uniref:glycosyltransferase family 4 protein n=1 Tax=Candidatus Neomicrothrix parvicella TaxID=41950 RepID=UPI00037B0A70|nr:glycosyltransferase family 4 protein [Candidatus Microthrix parvicella]
MKVLHVIDALGLGGGAEQALAVMLPLLRERGVDSSVACLIPREGGIQARLSEEGFPVQVLGPTSLPGRVRALRAKIAVESPNLVHCTLFNASLVARLALLGRPERLVNSLVNTSYDPVRVRQLGLSPLKLGVVQRIDGFTARLRVDRVHAITHAVEDEATRLLGVKPDRVEVIPRGRSASALRRPEPGERKAMRAKLGVGPATPVVLTVGRQDAQKNQAGLVRSFAEVRKRHPQSELWLVGREGDATDVLVQALENVNLGSSIRVLGHRDDALALIAAADVFAFPSYYEGLGSVLIEAMALGTPIVGSDAPAIAEVLGYGRYGRVTPRDDDRALAQAISGLLEDAALQTSLSEAARQRFQEYYELDLVADATVEMYRRVINE